MGFFDSANRRNYVEIVKYPMIITRTF